MTDQKTKQVQITKSAFRDAVSSGMNKEALANHFEISKAYVTKFAKDLEVKITITRNVAPKYILVDDEDEVAAEQKFSVDQLNEQLAN